MNHELRNWIVANGLATAEPAEVLSRLNEEVEVHRDSQRWTLSGIMARFGLMRIHTIEQRLWNAGFHVLVFSMISGVEFDSKETRENLMLAGQAGILTKEEVEMFLAIGLRFGPAWEKAGLTTCPTEEEIKLAQAAIAKEGQRQRPIACDGIRAELIALTQAQIQALLVGLSTLTQSQVQKLLEIQFDGLLPAALDVMRENISALTQSQVQELLLKLGASDCEQVQALLQLIPVGLAPVTMDTVCAGLSTLTRAEVQTLLSEIREKVCKM